MWIFIIWLIICYLRVDANDLATFVAIVGEDVLVALDAVGVVVPQHVPAQYKHHAQDSIDK